MFEIKRLVYEYPGSPQLWRPAAPGARALDDFSLSINKGEAVGLVGESGCGKSTLVRCLVRLLRAQSGSIHFRGDELREFRGRSLQQFRRAVQIVFQDPYASLNPRMRIGEVLSEVLMVHDLAPRKDRQRRVVELLDLVELDASTVLRFPHELSGGQRQRVGIARALATEPECLLCDEPVSALDVSVQAQILNLFKSLRERLGITYLFISHDLRVVASLCDRVVVMRAGQLVEQGSPAQLFAEPAHDYTRKLIQAIPTLTPRRQP